MEERIGFLKSMIEQIKYKIRRTHIRTGTIAQSDFDRVNIWYVLLSQERKRERERERERFYFLHYAWMQLTDAAKL